jgi:hypothetical protein
MMTARPPPHEDPSEDIEDNDDQGNDFADLVKQVEFSFITC